MNILLPLIAILTIAGCVCTPEPTGPVHTTAYERHMAAKEALEYYCDEHFEWEDMAYWACLNEQTVDEYVAEQNQIAEECAKYGDCSVPAHVTESTRNRPTWTPPPITGNPPVQNYDITINRGNW